jgi:ABC-2 type transport system ATP-binding protein
MSAIRFDQISKSYKYGLKCSTVLNEVSLAVAHGEIFGFLGPNGAGKSTSIKLLLNFIRPDSGRIFVDGQVVGRDMFQHNIGYLPETPCFYENLKGLELLWFAGKASGLEESRIRAKAPEVLERMKLEHAGEHLVKTYSKGMKQRLGLAMTLIHDPRIYILDEPMSGLDPMGRRLITDVLLELREKGKTVFFSSHILSDVEKLCDRIGILNKGELLFCGPVQEIVQSGDSLEDIFVELIEEHERTRNV